MKKAAIIVFLVLLVDQILKIYIKTHFHLGEEIHVMGDWFIIHFTENPGMAFGYELGFSWGKLALSLFRIGAIIALGFYIAHIVKRKSPASFVLSISLIMAGALGNMIDSAFYGMIFSDSMFHEVATAFPEGGGYASFLHGKVVDMFYFPLFSFTWPEWMPWLGGQMFTFFQPVFNVADASITIGVALILLFQKSFFKKDE
ncbi:MULTISPECIES: lipoprotein signal peptidase [unclassified Lentimicrobium]|uniref:lipoprotein signal peptidase n=1 Tax=unclassified Lentimicrobium TaxID=2677434 RepID=UPI001552C53C|nr:MULTISPECIES: lipoprotein signal peptidase [unclassified Lentimicrobium]NPD44009.1 lipoprotein signal peptidase [Lentimicrobium sp. S6]NPD84077.1 lipoprotein signal peptidase [Lentimicrobium sp. L6]